MQSPAGRTQIITNENGDGTHTITYGDGSSRSGPVRASFTEGSQVQIEETESCKGKVSPDRTTQCLPTLRFMVARL